MSGFSSLKVFMGFYLLYNPFKPKNAALQRYRVEMEYFKFCFPVQVWLPFQPRKVLQNHHPMYTQLWKAEALLLKPHNLVKNTLKALTLKKDCRNSASCCDVISWPGRSDETFLQKTEALDRKCFFTPFQLRTTGKESCR